MDVFLMEPSVRQSEVAKEYFPELEGGEGASHEVTLGRNIQGKKKKNPSKSTGLKQLLLLVCLRNTKKARMWKWVRSERMRDQLM